MLWRSNAIRWRTIADRCLVLLVLLCAWQAGTYFVGIYWISSPVAAAMPGVRALDPSLVQMAQIAGASERQVARHIVMPAAVPNIFAGFRIAVPYAISSAIIAELISSNRGLGYLVQTGAMNLDTTSV